MIDALVLTVTMVKNREGQEPIVFSEKRVLQPDAIDWISRRNEYDDNVVNIILAGEVLSLVEKGEAVIEAGKSREQLIEEFGEDMDCELVDGNWRRKNNGPDEGEQ
jgi:hypothetical protein